MNKRIVSIIAIATIMLSLMAFVPMSNAVSPSNVMQPNLNKLAPNLRAQIEANPTGNCRIEVVLKPGVDKASALNHITGLGGTINVQHNIINAISVTISADKIPVLTSLVDVDKVLVDGKKYLPPTLQGDDSGAAINNLIQYGEWYAQFPFWIGADQAWQMGIDGTGVIVADLDTGIFYEHPDLDGVVIDYKVFTGEVDAFPHDGSGHGTATTGCVAAQGLVDWFGGDPFPFRIKGVAPGAKVIGGKVMTDEGWGWDSWIIAGIEWAVTRGANIITMSLGGLEVPNDGYDPMCLALEAATQQGVTCFVAAGNDQGTGTVQSGGVAHDVITVGASTEGAETFWLFGYWPYDAVYPWGGYENDQMIFWSGGGPTADGRLDPDICAIGAWGTSLDTYPYYVFVQFGGTSMATPVAAGAGALVLQAYKQAHGVFPSPAVARKILMNTAKDIGYPANRQGAGRVDALKAVKAALSQAPYSDTDEINKMLPAGACDVTRSAFTDNIDSAHATKLQMVDSVSFSLSVPNGDTYVPVAFPAGTEFADVRVKFASEIAYGTPIHSYDGTTWTDVHINTALYSAPAPDYWILINYAYAHTNVQWFDARVTPGDYVLRLWNQYATVDPVDVQINFYKFVPWTWISTTINGKKLQSKISVPPNASPGSYSGFVKATCGGSLVDIPIVITVPAKLGQTFTAQTNIMNEPRDFASGDWIYIPVKACIIGNLMLTVSWTTPDADFDVYLINPAGEARAQSVAPRVPVYYTGGGGCAWYTTTGTTMEMLSTLCLFPGYWYVGIHAIYFGNTFSQTVTVNLDQGKPINAPCFLNLKKGTSKTFTVSNNIPGTVSVQTMVLSLQMEQYAWALITGTVTSFDGVNQGWEGWNLRVTPDMVTFTVTLNWVGSLKMGLSLWDPAGRNVAVVNTNGGSITVNNPAVGWWGAIITIDETGSQDYTLTVSGLRFKALSGVTITPATFTLPAMGTQTVTISATPQASGAGVIVYYDLATGSTYARTLLTITR